MRKSFPLCASIAENTRAFNNHFSVAAHAQNKTREERTAGELSAAIAKDYEILVGADIGELNATAAKARCQDALAQIAPLKPVCEGKAFAAIDIDACIEAIKDAEGGPKRERLGACIRERGDLAKVNHEAPTAGRAAQLTTLAAEREDALARTAGDLMLQLYQAGSKVVETEQWEDPHLCPLCDGTGTHSLRDHLASKLSEFEALDTQFYGLTNVSPQALLSESFRNAFAISLYLAAASLYGGLPKFLVLDDVTSSFDAGHQHFLVELIRTTFARPGNATGPQVILLSHDTMLEKLFNKHSGSGTWWHQRLEGSPQVVVLPQAGAVNKVRDRTISMLQAGQVDSAKEGVRQYLEYRLSDLISKLRIPVPVDIAFNDDKQLSSEFLKAIEAAVKLHKAANSLELDAAQQAGLNTNMVTIVGNFLSHWGTGQAAAFSGPSLLGVMQAIDDYCDCFTFAPTPGAARVYYKSLSQRQ
ncbi:hypothetical protein CO653_21465 [Rhizobium anhuiense]|uniref:ABC transporter ATP-binding protein n=1 Tax=Rhizobium anhuiense TaxID=1184720 RepID=UPI000BE82046|nr:ABC transporter ATP-binding protein [Rhizobium anhuiense]PDS63521.1 hypothetical protein CO653_21465 [Rhizobium anhuiense]